MTLAFHDGFETGSADECKNLNKRMKNPFANKPLRVRYEEPGRIIELEIDKKKSRVVSIELPSVVVIG